MRNIGSWIVFLVGMHVGFAQAQEVNLACEVFVTTESDTSPRAVGKLNGTWPESVAVRTAPEATLARIYPTEETSPGDAATAPDFDGRLETHVMPEYLTESGVATLRGVKIVLRHVLDRRIVGGARAVFARDRVVPPALSFTTSAGRLVEAEVRCSEK